MSNLQRRILILEDDPSLREAMADCLLDQGHQVDTAGRGEEAVQLASEKDYDLFISDIRMEGMDGLSAIEHATSKKPGLGSMVVSGYASQAETLRAVELNVGAYLRKPFSLDEFLKHVNQLLERRELQMRHFFESKALRRCLLWSIQSYLQQVDQTGFAAPAGSLERIALVASRLGQAASLPSEVTDILPLAGGLSVVAAHSAFNFPEFVSDELLVMAPLRTLAEQIRGRDQEDLPYPAKLGKIAVQAGMSEDGYPDPDQLWSELESSGIERECWVLYQREFSTLHEPQAPPSPEILSGLADPSRTLRSLVALGRTLEEAGDIQSARQAFERVLEDQTARPERVEALLGQARLALKAAKPNQCGDYATQAYQCAKTLGPVTGAQVCLDCGLLMLAAQLPTAVSALERAATDLQRLGLAGPEAVARLALNVLKPGPAEALRPYVQLLLQPQWSHAVAAQPRVLVPELIQLHLALGQTSTSPENASFPGWVGGKTHQDPMPVFRLLQNFPNELVVSQLGDDTKEQLLGLFEAYPTKAPHTVLEALVNDDSLRQRALQLLGARGSNPAKDIPALRLYCLGFFQVYCGSRQIKDNFNLQKPKYLLALLASEGRRPVTEDRILEELWPDSDLKGRKSLSNAISLLRKTLRGDSENDYDYIVRQQQCLSINPDCPYWNDVDELEQCLNEGIKLQDAGQMEKALENFRRALSLMRGPYLDGCYLEFANVRRHHLEEKFCDMLTRFSSLCLSSKRLSEALEASERLLTIDPSRQDGHLLKMRALLAMGHPEAVIRQFQKCDRLLRSEYGIEPKTELLEVYQRARYGIPEPV